MMFRRGEKATTLKRRQIGNNRRGWQQNKQQWQKSFWQHHPPGSRNFVINYSAKIKRPRKIGLANVSSVTRPKQKSGVPKTQVFASGGTTFCCHVLVRLIIILSFALTAVAFAYHEDAPGITAAPTDDAVRSHRRQEKVLATDAAELLDVLLDERVVVRGPDWLLDRTKIGSSSASSSVSSSSSSSYEDDDDGSAEDIPSSSLSTSSSSPLASQRTARRIIVQHHQYQQQEGRQRLPTKQHQRSKFLINSAHPIHILFPLPAREGRKTKNPFGITILKARPVVDEGVMEVYRRHLLPPNSLVTHFNDSKTSDAHGPNVAINMLVKNHVDCIIGYAFVYALAPVARMSPFWRDKDSFGIPVITSIGQTTNLDNREEYKLMTRISSPYKVVRDALFELFILMKWRKLVYMFHDERYTNQSVPHGECYLLMLSLQSRMGMLNRLEHNYYTFNEFIPDSQKLRENLKKTSMLTNGGWHLIFTHLTKYFVLFFDSFDYLILL